jgi:hypothetical protein
MNQGTRGELLMTKIQRPKLQARVPCKWYARIDFTVNQSVLWTLVQPPVRHCDTSTRTIWHCNILTPVMLRPCDTTSAIQLDSRFFVQANFAGAYLSIMFHPAPAILIVTIRPAWWWDTTNACKVMRMRKPNLTWGMVDPTRHHWLMLRWSSVGWVSPYLGLG